MFADPQSVTINTVAIPLPLIARNGRSGVYSTSDGSLTLTISHANAKRTRSVVRIDRKKVGADALNPSTNKQYVFSTYIVIDKPFTGFTETEMLNDVVGLLDLAKTSGFVSKVLGQQS